MKKRSSEEKHERKKRKKHKKQSRRASLAENEHAEEVVSITNSPSRSQHEGMPGLVFDHKYVLAPMVGASELAFRILCRKYGAQLAYTPMMSARQFATDPRYREEEFQTIPEDRPLVCHFAANDPDDFAAAAKVAEPFCDAVDLNLGCPQRTAFVGQFGSYLLGPETRNLVCSIVRAGAQTVKIPIFCKIRLLDTVEETITLCQQLRDAGASLIAIHARYRATYHRKGPGARDGPALLDQVKMIQKAVSNIPILTNGNVITYEDVEKNLRLTGASGVMSAEGILDNPALFLPRLGSRSQGGKLVPVFLPHAGPGRGEIDGEKKAKRKLKKKLREIEHIEDLQVAGEELNEDQRMKLSKKATVTKKLEQLVAGETRAGGGTEEPMKHISLARLYESADDAIGMASEYLSLVKRYPVKHRSVVFHIRRMLREVLNQYQLMEECVSSASIKDIEVVLNKLRKYEQNPSSFKFDQEKATREREILERKKVEESRRKNFEARMLRKAKREGKDDPEYYLRRGIIVPTVEFVKSLKSKPIEMQLEAWRQGNHSQHCMAFHLNVCKRDRACAFLHVEAKDRNTFVESDEVAG